MPDWLEKGPVIVLSAVIACARHLVGESLRYPSGIQRSLLLLQSLGNFADSCVSDALTRLMVVRLRNRLFHNSYNVRFETSISETNIRDTATRNNW